MLTAKGGKKDENVAFYSNDSGKGQKGGSNSKRDKNVECFNCHKKGHKKPDCWAPGGGKEGQGPNQKGKEKDKDKEKGKETAAVTKENEKTEKKLGDDEVWMASTDSDFEGEEVRSSNFNSDLSMIYLRITQKPGLQNLRNSTKKPPTMIFHPSNPFPTLTMRVIAQTLMTMMTF